MKTLRLAMLGMVLCLSTGCATIMSDNKTFTQIESYPSEAECTVEGDNYKQVIKTPANLQLPAKAAPIAISCVKDGFHMEIEKIDTKLDGMTFGNILFGGLIGVIVDASTKSGHKYPEKVTLSLHRKTFANLEERNTWYDTTEKELNDTMDRKVQEALAGCSDSDRDMCERKVKKINQFRDEKVAALRRNKEASIVTPELDLKQQPSHLTQKK